MWLGLLKMKYRVIILIKNELDYPWNQREISVILMHIINILFHRMT